MVTKQNVDNYLKFHHFLLMIGKIKQNRLLGNNFDQGVSRVGWSLLPESGPLFFPFLLTNRIISYNFSLSGYVSAYWIGKRMSVTLS